MIARSVADLVRDLRAQRTSRHEYNAQAARLNREAFAALSAGQLRKHVKARAAAAIAERAALAETDDPEPAA
jgi:hypothetical protein